MIVRGAGLGSDRNGLPEADLYVYRGCGVDVLEARGSRAGTYRGKRSRWLPDRVLAALEALGGEATGPEIRNRVELDGGAPFLPQYMNQVLSRLARRDPPAVVLAGRDSSANGRPGRWRLGPGAGGAA